MGKSGSQWDGGDVIRSQWSRNNVISSQRETTDVIEHEKWLEYAWAWNRRWLQIKNMSEHDIVFDWE